MLIINPFRAAVPLLGTNQSNSRVVCPQNGTAVLKGLIPLLALLLIVYPRVTLAMRFPSSSYHRQSHSSRACPHTVPAKPPPPPPSPRAVRRPVANRIFKKSESLAVSDAEATSDSSPTTPPKAMVCPERPPVHHIRSESPPSSDMRATADPGRSSGPAKYEVSLQAVPGTYYWY